MKVTCNKNKKSSLFAKKNILPTLSLNIVLKEPLNSLFKLFRNYGKSKKRKPRAALMS